MRWECHGVFRDVGECNHLLSLVGEWGMTADCDQVVSLPWSPATFVSAHLPITQHLVVADGPALRPA